MPSKPSRVLPAVDDPPRTDPSGEVDLDQVDYQLSLTPAERMRHHYETRRFVELLRAHARERYGSAIDAVEEVE